MCKRLLVSFVVLLLGLFTAGRAIATVEPLGWWPLNEGTGNVAHDISGNNHDGTIYNVQSCYLCSTWVNDPERGMVLRFSGNDSMGAYVDAGMIIGPLTLDQDFTWAFWAMQFEDGGGINETMLGNRHGASIDLNFAKFTPTNFEFYNQGNITGKINYTDIPACEWLFHVVVKEGGEFGSIMTYYRFNLNGELVETLGSITDTELVVLPLYMGGDAGGERWSGALSDVRIYDQALTYDEVRAIVPEPATIALLSLGGMTLLGIRRKR